MAATYEVLAKLKADTSDFDRGMNSAAATADGFASKVGTAMKGVAGFVAGAAAAATAAGGAFGVMAFNAASDLNESLTKVGVVFGENAKDIEKWASTSASAMGLSKQQALEAAGTFGNFMQAMGITRGEAGDMSKAMVGLASDLASFNNANPEDVLLALRSGLAGETEPLRKFGVNLSAARVEAEALAQGINKNYNELTGAEKATLSYAIIMKDTAMAQGDFARTAEGAANQMRIMKAQIKDVAAVAGQALLPIGTTLIQSFTSILTEIAPVLGEIAGIIGTSLMPVAESLGPLLKGALTELAPMIKAILPPLLDSIAKLLDGLGPVFIELINPVMSLFTALTPLFDPLVEIIVTLADLLGGIFATAFQGLADMLGTVASALAPFLSQLADALQPGLEAIGSVLEELPMDTFASAIESIALAIGPLLPMIGELASTFLTMMADQMKVLIPVIARVAELIGGVLGSVLSTLAPIISDLAKKFGDVFGRIMERLAPILEKVADLLATVLVSVVDALAPVLPTLADAVLQLLDAFIPLIEPLLELVEILLPPLADLLKLLLPPIVKLAGYLVGGLASGLSTVIGWFTQLTEKVSPLSGIFQTLGNVLTAVWNGISAAVSTAWNTVLKPIWDAIKGFIETVLIPVFDWLWTHLQIVWDAISAKISEVWNNNIKPIWDAIYSFIENTLVPKFEAMKETVSNVFNAAKDIITNAWNSIKDKFNMIKDAVTGLINRFGEIKDGIGNAFSNLFDMIISPFKSAFNWIADKWNSTIGSISFGIPGTPFNFDVPNMPTFHKGGMVPGRLGSDVPAILQAGEMVLSRPQVAALNSMPAKGTGGAVVVNYDISVNVPVTADQASVGRSVVEAISAYERRNGSNWRS